MKLWPFGKDGEPQENTATTHSTENTTTESPVTAGKPAGGGLANFYQNAHSAPTSAPAPSFANTDMATEAPAHTSPTPNSDNGFDAGVQTPVAAPYTPDDNAFNFDSKDDDFSVENLFAENPAPAQTAASPVNVEPVAASTPEVSVTPTPNATPGRLPEVDVQNFVGTQAEQTDANGLNHMAFISKNGDIWDAPDPNHQPDDLSDAFSSTSSDNPTETMATPETSTSEFSTSETMATASNDDLDASMHNADLSMGEFDMTGFEIDASFDDGFSADFGTSTESIEDLGFDATLDDGFTPTANTPEMTTPALNELSAAGEEAETTDDPFTTSIGDTTDSMMADFAMPEVITNEAAIPDPVDTFAPSGTEMAPVSETVESAETTKTEAVPAPATPVASVDFDMAAFLAPPADDLTPAPMATTATAPATDVAVPSNTQADSPATIDTSTETEVSTSDETMMPPASNTPLSVDEAMAPPSDDPVSITTSDTEAKNKSDTGTDVDLMPPDFENHSLLDMFKSKPTDDTTEVSAETPTPEEIPTPVVETMTEAVIEEPVMSEMISETTPTITAEALPKEPIANTNVSSDLALVSVNDSAENQTNDYSVNDTQNTTYSFDLSTENDTSKDSPIGLHFVAGVTGTRYQQQDGQVPPVIGLGTNSLNTTLEAGSQSTQAKTTATQSRKKGLKRFEELVQLAQAGDLPLTDSQRQAFVEELLLKECQMTKEVLDHMITSYFNHDDGIHWEWMNDIKNEAVS